MAKKEEEKPATDEQPKEDDLKDVDPKDLLKEIIDPQRIDQIAQVNEQLQARVAELEKKPQSQSQSSSAFRGWDTVSEQDLEYIVTHPAEYPDHVAGAFKEVRKRDREAIKTEVSGEVGVQNFRSRNQEAFDPVTPLGKEVTKILGQNRSQEDVLSDVIELAQHRIGGNKAGEKARKQVIDNLKAADTHIPGSDTLHQSAAPSFMDMPKADFEKEVQKVKLKTFK